jgi:protein-S-isoprenylcysteine O-methyltransferase Ste14
LLHAAANVGVAATFLATLLLWEPQLMAILPWGSRLLSARAGRPANLSAWIAIICALVMALLSLVRAAPREARTDYQALVALSGMLILPLLMRPLPRFAALTRPTPAGVAFEAVGLVFQFSGLCLMQVALLYLGRHFGLLPANRGLVTRGPFRLIRHPVYAAWLVYASGTLMVVPTIRNLELVALTIPFMVWRITLEEELLDHDPQYRAYRQRVHWRLVPGVF